LLWSFGRKGAVMSARPLLEPGSGACRADRRTLVHPFKTHPALVNSVCARALLACARPIRRAGSRFSGTYARPTGLRMAFDKSRRKIDRRDAVADFFPSVNCFTFKRHRRWHLAVANEQKHSFPQQSTAEQPEALLRCKPSGCSSRLLGGRAWQSTLRSSTAYS
jgi:hypothetical protein